MSWFTILKGKSVEFSNGFIMLYDPREISAEQAIEKHYPFDVIGGKHDDINTWIPIDIKDANGASSAPSINSHISAIEKKLGKSLSKDMKERMLESEDIVDFMQKMYDQQIGFIYIAPTSSWREKVPFHFGQIGYEQGNGFKNMINAVPIPKDYWHYDTAMNNKGGVVVSGGKLSVFHQGSRFYPSKMTQALRELDEEIANHRQGIHQNIERLMEKVIAEKLDKDW